VSNKSQWWVSRALCDLWKLQFVPFIGSLMCVSVCVCVNLIHDKYWYRLSIYFGFVLCTRYRRVWCDFYCLCCNPDRQWQSIDILLEYWVWLFIQEITGNQCKTELLPLPVKMEERWEGGGVTSKKTREKKSLHKVFQLTRSFHKCQLHSTAAI